MIQTSTEIPRIVKDFYLNNQTKEFSNKHKMRVGRFNYFCEEQCVNTNFKPFINFLPNHLQEKLTLKNSDSRHLHNAKLGVQNLLSHIFSSLASIRHHYFKMEDAKFADVLAYTVAGVTRPSMTNMIAINFTKKGWFTRSKLLNEVLNEVLVLHRRGNNLDDKGCSAYYIPVKTQSAIINWIQQFGSVEEILDHMPEHKAPVAYDKYMSFHINEDVKRNIIEMGNSALKSLDLMGVSASLCALNNITSDKTGMHFNLYYEESETGRLQMVGDFNPQLMKKKMRNKIFEGYFDYDISSSAQSLLWQYLDKEIRKLIIDEEEEKLLDIAITGIKYYVDNKKKMREEIAEYLTQTTGVCKEETLGMAKTMFTAMGFANAPSYAQMKRSSMDLISNITGVKDYSFYDRVEGMQVYACATNCFHTLMSRINKRDPNFDKNVMKNVKMTRISSDDGFTASQRTAHLYFGLERTMMDAMIEYVKSKNADMVIIHDGFISSKDIPPEDIERYVRQKTGYSIKLDAKQL